jgi:hypothetical protein
MALAEAKSPVVLADADEQTHSDQGLMGEALDACEEFSSEVLLSLTLSLSVSNALSM